jgi:hypothetical protein
MLPTRAQPMTQDLAVRSSVRQEGAWPGGRGVTSLVADPQGMAHGSRL